MMLTIKWVSANRCIVVFVCLFLPFLKIYVYFTEEDDTLSLPKDSSHNSSFELMGSMIPSYQPVSRAAGRGLSASAFRSPSPCLFRPSFLGSASKVRHSYKLLTNHLFTLMLFKFFT